MTQLQVSIAAARKIAKGMVGIKYLDYGRDMSIGLDCWGMVIAFFGCIGLSLPDPVSCYDRGMKPENWCEKLDLVGQYQHLNFVQTDKASPLSVVAMKIRSNIVNHLALYIDSGEVLNADPVVGVHLTREFALKHHIAYYLKLNDLLVEP